MTFIFVCGLLYLGMSYPPEIFDKICDLIAGGESVNSILQAKDMPSRETFYKWIRNDEDKADRYARAKSYQADVFCEEIVEIADKASKDIELDGDGKPYIDGFAVQRARLMIDTRKWVMAKNNLKKYGDKVQNDVTVTNLTLSDIASNTYGGSD